MSWVVRLIVVIPALAAIAGLLARRSVALSRAIAVGSAAVVTVLALTEWIAPAGRGDIDTWGGLPLGDLSIPLHLLSDRLSGLVAFVVALVVLCIQAYTVWYLDADLRYPQFAAGVSLFAAGMLLVVQASDLVLMLIGWEIMGWCSWLLIGHDSERAAARRAAYKAFIVTRIADIAMVVGLITLSVRARSTDLLTVLTEPGRGGVLTLGLVLVVIGIAGKSGLIPFHDWLPDAMEGPTPASALIHAATMVAAGSYIIARLFSLYAVDGASSTVLAVLAALTMVYAAGLAFAQTDLKRLLAYSTLSQVAIILAALAAAPASVGEAPGMAHLVGHAFFKALLFLGAGWLAALVGATALAPLRGRLRGRGALRWAMGAGLAALAGVPPLVGFFTKDTVIDAALEGVGAGAGARAWIVVVALFVTVVLTAAYCTRAWLLLDTPPNSPNAVSEVESSGAPVSSTPNTAFEEENTAFEMEHPGSGQLHGRHSPITLTAATSVAVLAVLSVLGTLLLLGLRGAIHVGVLSAILSVLLIAGAALGVFAMSRSGARDAADVLPQRVGEAAVRGLGVDTAYAALGRAVVAVARLVVVLDRDVIDAYPRAAAATSHALGRAGERSHRSVPSPALIGLLTGVVVVAVLGVTAWR